MAIINRQNDSLASAKIIKNTTQKEGENVLNPKPQNEKKPGFIRSTFSELSKVQWPSARYVFNTSIVILIFTALFAISLGFVDRVLTTSVIWGDCASRVAKQENKDGIGDCNREFFEVVTYRKSIKSS